MRTKRLMAAATAVLAVAALGIGAASAQGPAGKWGWIDDARMANADHEPQNWLMHSGNNKAYRYSGLDQITPDNVKNLKPVWSLDLDTNRGQEATPIVVDGVAYITTAWSKAYAVDAKTGRQLWYFDPKTPGEAGPKACCDVVNRGGVVYKGKFIFGTLDGRLIALDAKTGKQIWSTMTVDPDGTLTVTSTPAVGKGLVYIGNAGGDFGGRGYIGAYDAETGKFKWRFWLTPGAKGVKDNAPSDEIMDKVVQPTWFGPNNEYRGGANVWGALVFDPELDQVYLATGDGFPWNRFWRSEGKGDNLFIASIVALDAKTGKYKWHYQETPGEAWDLDAVADMTLLDLPVKGKTVKALIHTPKAGYAWELDRRTGKVISGVPFVDGVTWTSGLDPKTGRPIMNEAMYYDNKTPARSYPGGGGAHSWQPTSYSPKTGLLYLNARQGPPGVFTPKPTYEWVKGIDNIGIFMFGQAVPAEIEARTPPMPANAVANKSFLLAWNPVTQTAAWRTEGSGTGVLATAGNLVFQGGSRGGVMGKLLAFRADNGQQVWSYDIPNAVLTGPVSYMIDGEQYVMTISGALLGIAGGGPDTRAAQPGRLVAFKLNGTGTLPADPPMARPVRPPPEDQTWPAADLIQASDNYAIYCAHCHGVSARNNNVVPDLRRSPYLQSKAAWSSVVEGGILKDKGMVGWTRYLKPGQAEAIRGYVAQEARKTLANPNAGRPTGPVQGDQTATGL